MFGERRRGRWVCLEHSEIWESQLLPESVSGSSQFWGWEELEIRDTVQVTSAGGILTTSATLRGEVAPHRPDSPVLELALGSWELRPHLKSPAFHAQE